MSLPGRERTRSGRSWRPALNWATSGWKDISGSEIPSPEAECRRGKEAETDMPASHFEFHVEELSMEAFLAACLPGILSADCTFGIYPYPGKDALLRKIGDRLKGYATWMPAEYRIVVVVDRDGDECEELKSRLEQICESAGLRSRRAAGGPDWQVVTRIAIEELEAWYFGDWPAVCAAYPRVSANIPSRSVYQDPMRSGAAPGGIRTSPAESRIF